MAVDQVVLNKITFYIPLFNTPVMHIICPRCDSSRFGLSCMKRLCASEKLKDLVKEDVHQFRPREEKYDGPGS